MKIKTNIKDIEIKFHFGMAIFDIFCDELGNTMEDFSKLGEYDKQKALKLSKDLYYSSAKAHAELNETQFSFINENGKEVFLKPIHFSHLVFDTKFNAEFEKALSKMVEDSLPKAEQPKVKKEDEEKKLIGTE